MASTGVWFHTRYMRTGSPETPSSETLIDLQIGRTRNSRSLNYFAETPSQTAGPYVHIGLIPHQAGFDIFEQNFTNELAGAGTRGECIRIEGTVFDGAEVPIRDALVELWQANAAGKYNHPADRQEKATDNTFRGWCRAGADFNTGVW